MKMIVNGLQGFRKSAIAQRVSQGVEQQKIDTYVHHVMEYYNVDYNGALDIIHADPDSDVYKGYQMIIKVHQEYEKGDVAGFKKFKSDLFEENKDRIARIAIENPKMVSKKAKKKLGLK